MDESWAHRKPVPIRPIRRGSEGAGSGPSLGLADTLSTETEEGIVTLWAFSRKCSDNCRYETNCSGTQRTC
jgi:hypothetical protein